MLVPTLGAAARIFVAAGRDDDAQAVGRELLRTPRIVGEFRVLEFAWVAAHLGLGRELREFLEEFPAPTRWTRAALALVEGDYAWVADAPYEIGHLDGEAAARLRAAEKLVAEGRRAEAEAQLEKALAFFRAVGATRFIREAEALLPASVERRTSVGQ